MNDQLHSERLAQQYAGKFIADSMDDYDLTITVEDVTFDRMERMLSDCVVTPSFQLFPRIKEIVVEHIESLAPQGQLVLF